jgi:biotin carboxyl carrier protein
VHYEIEVNGRLRQVAVHRVNGRFAVTIDGREWTIDAARVDGHTWSLLIDGEVGSPSTAPSGTKSYEVTLAPDAVSGGLIARVGAAPLAVSVNGRRRWGRKDDGAQTASGPERLVAPMPGKIVRVLVKPGEAIRVRQPLIVIEAMKMENELRAGGDGTIAEIHVRDGQSVDAGALLAVIHR